MSILITGANGAIGFDLVNLLSQYKKIYAVTRKKKIKELTMLNGLIMILKMKLNLK